MKAVEKARFDTRLSKEQKELFEHAARLGGFRTLSEFVIFSAQQQASSIIEKHNTALVSKRDQESFFDALLNPQPPNDALTQAAMRHKREVGS